MNIYKKLGKEKVHQFLLDNGFTLPQLRVMDSRKKISSRAALAIMAGFKNYEIRPEDFYLTDSDSEKEEKENG